MSSIASRVRAKNRKARGQRSLRSRAFARSIRTIPMGFPQTQSMKHNYFYRSDTFAPGVPYVQDLYNVNSLYDPDRTGSGRQPGLYDNMSAIYRRYRVTHAVVKCTFYNNNDQPGIASIIYQGNNTTDLSNAVTYDPNALGKYSKSVILTGNHLEGCIKTLTLKIPLVKIEGKKVLYDDQYSGLSGNVGVGGNPAIPLMVSMNFCTSTGAVCNILMHVSIKYTAIWELPYTAEQIMLD